MKKSGKLAFVVGILSSIILIAQAVLGITMYVKADHKDTAGQKVERPDNTDRAVVLPSGTGDTTDDTGTAEADPADGKEAANDSEADSNINEANSGTDSIGMPPQSGSGFPGDMPGSGIRGGDSFSANVLDFYQGSGGLAVSIAVLIVGAAGVITLAMARKSMA